MNVHTMHIRRRFNDTGIFFKKKSELIIEGIEPPGLAVKCSGPTFCNATQIHPTRPFQCDPGSQDESRS